MIGLKRLLLGVAGVVGGLVMAAQPVSAQVDSDNGTSLTTSPVSMSLDMAPGTSTTRTLQVMNNGSQPISINMQLDEFSANSVNGDPIIKPIGSHDPSANWVSFSPASFVAQPLVWESVSMTINLPTTAQLGYYYTVVFAPVINTKAQARSNTIKGNNGVLVLIDTQSSGEKRQISIGDFSVEHHIYDFLPVKFDVSIKNSGNIYLAPYGNIYISRNDAFTSTLAAIPVNASAGNVLPDSVRSFESDWSDGFPVFANKTVAGQNILDKNGQPVQQLKWDFSKLNHFRFGRYYAKLTLIYSDGQRTVPLTSVISFWVIPVKLLLIGLLLAAVVLGFVGVGLYVTSRSLRRKFSHKAGPKSV